jgi:hypothetical protein
VTPPRPSSLWMCRSRPRETELSSRTRRESETRCPKLDHGRRVACGADRCRRRKGTPASPTKSSRLKVPSRPKLRGASSQPRRWRRSLECDESLTRRWIPVRHPKLRLAISPRLQSEEFVYPFERSLKSEEYGWSQTYSSWEDALLLAVQMKRLSLCGPTCVFEANGLALGHVALQRAAF